MGQRLLPPDAPPRGRVAAGRRQGDGVGELVEDSEERVDARNQVPLYCTAHWHSPHSRAAANSTPLHAPFFFFFSNSLVSPLPSPHPIPTSGEPGSQPAPPPPDSSALVPTDEDDAGGDDGEDEDDGLGGKEGDDYFDDLDEDDDEEEEEEEEEEDDEDSSDDLFSDTDEAPDTTMEGDDAGLDEEADDLLLDAAAAAALSLGGGGLSAPSLAASLLDAVAAGGPGAEGGRRARRAGGAPPGAVGLPDPAGEDGGEEAAEEEVAEEGGGPIAYPPTPDRAWGLSSLLAAAGITPAALAGLAPGGAPLSLDDPASLEAVVGAGVESDPGRARPGDILAWRGPPPRSGPATPPPYPDFHRGVPCTTAGEAVAQGGANGAAAVVVVAEPGSPEDADPAAAAAALSAGAGGLPVVIVSHATAVDVQQDAVDRKEAVAAAEAAAGALAAEEAEGEQAAAQRPPPITSVPWATLAGGGPAAAGPPVAAVGTALASTFYGAPGTTPAMPTIAFVGGPGKTTAAWLVRGILEEAGALVALVDSSEYALHADRLDDGGGLWAPAEADPTADRETSPAFHLAPYQGKYPEPERHPDGVRVVRVLAGGADRGAGAAVVCLGDGALASGAGAAISPSVLVYTGGPTERVTGAALPADSPEFAAILAAFASLTDSGRQVAVVNMDDPLAREVIEVLNVPHFTFSQYARQGIDLACTKHKPGLWETEVTLQPVPDLRPPNDEEEEEGAPDAGAVADSSPDGAPPPKKAAAPTTWTLRTPLIGRHNVSNILAATLAGMVAAGREEGEGVGGEAAAGGGGGAVPKINLLTCIRGVEATEVVPGRSEVVDENSKFAVIVDAADNAASLGTLLVAVRDAGAKRIITVVGGDGGAPSPGRAFLGEAAHYKSDIVIVANANPRGEAPDAVAADVCAGFPQKLLAANARAPYPPGFLQDPGRVSSTTLEFLMAACWQHKRYVCEDRWMAIRWAIGTAQAGDAVVLAGKGAQDFIEWADEDGAPIRGWFDDRVEARHAQSKVHHLWAVTPDLDATELPWVEWDEREKRE